VNEFGGDEGRAFRGQLEQAIERNGFHELIDRSQLDNLIREQQLAASAMARSDGTLQLGDLLSAGAYVVGDADVAHKEQVSHQARKCSRYNSNTRKSEEYPCTEHTREGRANYTVTAKIIAVSTGKIIGTRTYRKERRQSSSATDGQPREIDFEAMDDSLRAEIVGDVMKVIAPYPVIEEVELVTDGDLPTLKAGNRFAVQNQWQQALTLYGEALAMVNSGGKKLDPETVAKAHYSVGIALVMSGDFKRGIEELKAAVSSDPDDDYVAMVARAESWRREADAVKAQSGDASGVAAQ
jgi:tetratricopeptide (TPR) repeat protein